MFAGRDATGSNARLEPDRGGPCKKYRTFATATAQQQAAESKSETPLYDSVRNIAGGTLPEGRRLCWRSLTRRARAERRRRGHLAGRRLGPSIRRGIRPSLPPRMHAVGVTMRQEAIRALYEGSLAEPGDRNPYAGGQSLVLAKLWLRGYRRMVHVRIETGPAMQAYRRARAAAEVPTPRWEDGRPGA